MTSPMDARENCPFCDFAPFLPYHDERTDSYFVYCDGCQCEGPNSATEAEAIAAWNRRGMLPDE